MPSINEGMNRFLKGGQQAVANLFHRDRSVTPKEDDPDLHEEVQSGRPDLRESTERMPEPAPSPEKPKKGRLFKVLGFVVAVLLFLGCGYFFARQRGIDPLARLGINQSPFNAGQAQSTRAQPPKQANAQGRAQTGPNGPASTRNPASPARPEPSRTRQESPVPQQNYNSNVTIGTLSNMRGRRLLMEQQVKIAELEKKLDDLRMREEPKKIEIVQAPPPPVVTPPPATAPAPDLDLDNLTPPRKRRNVEPTIVSIQGVGGQLSASIRNRLGKVVTVKNGGSFDGGTVYITKNGVTYRKNGKTQNLQFD